MSDLPASDLPEHGMVFTKPYEDETCPYILNLEWDPEFGLATIMELEPDGAHRAAIDLDEDQLKWLHGKLSQMLGLVVGR